MAYLTRTLRVIFFVLLLFLVKLTFFVELSHAILAQAYKTGQTTCYDAVGTIISCSGTGQDGALTPGVPWPSPRFTDNNNGTATDNLTGLIWLKNANCLETVGGIAKGSSGTLPWNNALAWSNALANGACGLNDGSAAGDWRLPASQELESLVDASKTRPPLPAGHPFTNVRSWYYWTSTTWPYSTASAWSVDMDIGGDSYGNASKFNTFNVWPVRGGLLGNPTIAISPLSKSFGNVAVGGNSSQAFTISNTATSDSSRLQINSIALRNADSAFTLNAVTCGPTPILTPGSSCTVTVTFSPTSTGAKSATLRISGSDAIAPNTDIQLNGTGASTASVTASVSGGNGTISSTNPVTVISGSTASFTLSPNTNYLPSGTVTGTCPVGSWSSNIYTTGTITANCTVGFTFTKITYPLTLTNVGSGSTSAAATGYSTQICGGNCSYSYDINTVVTLTTAPTTGYTFTGWSGGGCTGIGTCQITMDGTKSVTATFVDITPPDTTITSGPPVSTTSTSFSFVFTATEGGSTFECQLNSGAWGSCTSPYSNTFYYPACTSCPATSYNNFGVRAKDQAGNTDLTPATWNWTVNYPISSIIDNVQDGGVVQLPAAQLVQGFTLSRPVSFIIRGGYSADYTSYNNAASIIQGTITISAGTITMDNIAISP